MTSKLGSILCTPHVVLIATGGSIVSITIRVNGKAARCWIVLTGSNFSISDSLFSPNAIEFQRITYYAHSVISVLLCKEGIFTTKKTVSRWILRWSTQSGLVDNPRVGRPSKITADIGKFIEELLKSDDELSSLELHRFSEQKISCINCCTCNLVLYT